MVLGLLVIYAGYSLGSYGWVLVKGYNITPREWFSPLHPFQGPLSSNGLVPQGHIFPTASKGTAGAPKTGGGIQANPPGVSPGAPNPHGFVQ
jgi:hypothetical protein